jgi:hypothetical protein
MERVSITILAITVPETVETTAEGLAPALAAV